MGARYISAPLEKMAEMAEPESELGPRTFARVGAKGLGAFYTPPDTADVMARWILESSPSRVLEPSVGEGAFVRALRAAAGSRGVSPPSVLGVEIAPDTFAAAVRNGTLELGSSRNCDFLDVECEGTVDAAVGNPPYVRLRHTDPGQRERALAVSRSILGREMEPSGSLWMPFVLHAGRALREGGRMAFVLPFEFTYVRYAQPLWSHLAESFGELRLVRVRERMFADIMQETVLLFASGKGGVTTEVDFEVYETLVDLDRGRPSVVAPLDVAEIVAGGRPFTRGHLSPELRSLLAGMSEDRMRPASAYATWRTGFVSGDKDFFHPSPDRVADLGLSPASVTPALGSGREVGKAGVSTGTAKPQRFLFSPLEEPDDLAPGDAAYVRHGEATGVHERYKCRVRSPWYRVPYVRVPDLVLPVFGSDPFLVMNEGGFVASNSYLCGYTPEGTDPDPLVVAWYSSLTLLEAELKVHSLGGGVLVFVPRELSAVRIARPELVDRDDVIRRMAKLRNSPDRSREFALGDDAVLRAGLGLTARDVDLIREGVEELRTWRKGSNALPEGRDLPDALAA